MTTPGFNPADGLVRPVNAPQGGQVVPGVQPGVSGAVVLASYVIVFGSSTAGGNAPGVFIYQGSPGPGNPPVFSMSNGTSDPYGNSIAPGIWAGQFGGIQAGLEVLANTGQLAFPVGGVAVQKAAGVTGFTSGGGAAINIFGPQDASPNNDRVGFILGDHLSIGSSAAYFLDYVDPSGVVNQHAVGGAAGLGLSSVSGIAGVLPGTGTAPANQAQPEVWHTAGFSNGWGASGSGVNGLFYRVVPVGPSGSNLVEVIGDIINAGAPANSVCSNLPVGYRPSTTQNHPAAVNNPQANNSASFPWISLATNGNIQVTGLQAVDTAAEVFFHFFAPLGTL